jgi:hypothetical protein
MGNAGNVTRVSAISLTIIIALIVMLGVRMFGRPRAAAPRA